MAISKAEMMNVSDYLLHNDPYRRRSYSRGDNGTNGDKHKHDGESGDDSHDENGKKRSKRRSKNDLDGRDYKWTFCPKTYLSYPALYTHMKTKHQSGTDNNQLLLNSGRGRGRPKKNAGRVTTIAPESDDYFKTLDKGGGPTDPLYFFNEIVQKFFINKNPNTKKEIEVKQEFPAAPEEKKAANSAQNSDVKEEVTANDKNSKSQENTEEQQKILNDHNHLSKEGEHSDVKEEVEESKSESQAKSQNKDLYDSSKNSNFKADFKQFSFKSYTDMKDHPFYEILSKKSLFSNKEGEVPKEVKEEQAEERPENDASKDIEMDEQEKQAKSEPKPKDEAIHDASMEDNIEVKSERRENTTPNEDEEEKIKEEPQNEENLFRKKRYDQVLEDYQKLTFNQKQELSCDEVWGIYLREISQKVNAKFYKTLLKFMILYRECCNEYGWQKIIESNKLLANEKIKVDIPVSSIPSTHKNALQQQQMIIIADIAKKSRDGKEDFCKVNSAESMPEVCNEFVTIFLEQREDFMDRGDAIDLTLNFCSWLYKKGHTCIKNTIKNYS